MTAAQVLAIFCQYTFGNLYDGTCFGENIGEDFIVEAK
jgi:hypothetical protein